MMNPESIKLLTEAGELTQNIGRLIGSPRNGLNDIQDLREALQHVEAALDEVACLEFAHLVK